ncbi:MAG TPA: hypothetical protein VI776_12920 [Anaerolineales bacterium]|jgi:hypothetical protein|nr:hypothetical protein [Anaerolineales bacterium]
MRKIPNGFANGYRTHLGLLLTLVGLVIFLIGAVPGLFGLDRSPVIGFVQIAVFLIGLGIICVGGFFTMNSLWRGEEKTIVADIGLRLVSTGYVIAVVSGLADIFGFGSMLFTDIPYFGPWQAGGVLFGEIVIILGFLLQIPYRKHMPAPDQTEQPTSAEEHDPIVISMD